MAAYIAQADLSHLLQNIQHDAAVIGGASLYLQLSSRRSTRTFLAMTLRCVTAAIMVLGAPSGQI